MTLDSYTPVSGDFNGDARTDFGLHDDNWGAEDVYFANSSGIFGSAQTGWVNYSIGDLNGDRRADYVLWGDTYLSTGTTHPLAEDGAFPFVWGYDILADFNGDGLDDVLHWGPPSSPTRCSSRRSGWVRLRHRPDGCCYSGCRPSGSSARPRPD
jgi:hypothetical protein